MPLRFTVTEKWQDKWFRGLKPKHKLLWLYLIDACDQSGMIELDVDIWSAFIGFTYTEEEIREVYAGRIIQIPNTDKIWIPKFIQIQQRCSFDELNPSNNAHKPIIKAIEKYRLLDLLGANEGLLSPTGKGNGNSKGNSNSKEQEIVKTTIEPSHDTPDFKVAWFNYMEHRKKIKKPLTPYAETLQLKKLYKYPVDLSVRMINESIANGWQGIFELKGNANAITSGGVRKSDQTARATYEKSAEQIEQDVRNTTESIRLLRRERS